METRFVQANGIRFAYFEEGRGPLALMFHGFPDTPHTWDDVRPKIAAKGYRVVTPFMRGYRPTEVPKGDADSEIVGRDALALIEALGEKQAILIGHDWGAGAVYSAAALDSSRITKLFAVGIPHPASVKVTAHKAWGVRHFVAYKFPGASRRFAANDFAALRAIYARWSPTWTPPDSEFAPIRECFADRSSLEAAFGYYRTLSFRPAAYLRKRIDVPTVVFSGLDDSVTDRGDYELAQRMFTGPYTIEEIPGGHFLHREHPEQFAERLLAHL